MSEASGPAAAAEPVAPRGERDLSGLRHLVWRRGAAQGDAIALTFDDGPVAQTAAALDALDAHGAKGTFFFVGEKVRGQEHLLARMVDDGHEIANHSFHHLYYPTVADIASASAQLRALTGTAPRLYRPPFGAIDRPTALAVTEREMIPVTWDVDSEDVFPVWEGLAPAQVERNVVDRARPGSIVLLHDGSVWSRAVEALPSMVATLLERGFRLVTVSELLAEAAAPEAPAATPVRRTPRRDGGSRSARARRWLGGRARLRSRRHDPARTVDEPLTGLGWGDQLESMKPREVLTWLERRSIPDERLGRAIAARVIMNPVAFSRHADLIVGLGAGNLRWVLAGLAQGVARTGAVDWDGVLEVVEATHAGEAGVDDDLELARREAALLLENALGAGTVAPAARERLWRSVERLSWSGLETTDPAAAEREAPVRVHAMCAVVHYAEWAGGSRGLAGVPEVRETLDAHLEPSREPSKGVRAVYGSQLSRLLALDRDWLTSRVAAILPADPGHAELREAAWAGHRLWGRPGADLFEILEDEYRREVAALPAPAALRRRDHGDPGRIVARHLGELYWQGAIGLDAEGVLSAFIARSAPDELAYLVKLMGLRAGSEEALVDEPVRRRLTALWEAISAEAGRRPSGADHEILAPFGVWYAGGALEAGRLDAELEALLSRGILVEPGFRVLERLAVRAAEDPAVTSRLAGLYVGLAGEWDLRATRESLGSIAAHAHASGDPAARDRALALEHALHAIAEPWRPVDAGQSALSS